MECLPTLRFYQAQFADVGTEAQRGAGLCLRLFTHTGTATVDLTHTHLPNCPVLHGGNSAPAEAPAFTSLHAGWGTFHKPGLCDLEAETFPFGDAQASLGSEQSPYLQHPFPACHLIHESGMPQSNRPCPHDGCRALLGFEFLVMASESSIPIYSFIMGPDSAAHLGLPKDPLHDSMV